MGGGLEAVWKFSENSSKIVHVIFPYEENVMEMMIGEGHQSSSVIVIQAWRENPSPVEQVVVVVEIHAENSISSYD